MSISKLAIPRMVQARSKRLKPMFMIGNSSPCPARLSATPSQRRGSAGSGKR